jgi:cytochrome c-type biogenesis protein
MTQIIPKRILNFILLVTYLHSCHPLKINRFFNQKITSRHNEKSVCLQLGFIEEIGVSLYDIQLSVSSGIQSSIQSPNILSLIIFVGVGMLSSLSPCSLSMIPLLSIYLGASEIESDKQLSYDTNLSQNSVKLKKSLLYSIGSALSFTFLGYFASVSGNTLNKNEFIGHITTFLVAIFAGIMGLNLLEVLRVPLPSLDFSEQRKSLNLPWQIEPVVFGASSALVLSPCTSPVLASLLAVVGTSQNSLFGAFYLFLFSLGYSLPTVLAVNSSFGAAKILSMSSSSNWINSLFGSLLVMLGTYFALDAGKSLL